MMLHKLRTAAPRSIDLSLVLGLVGTVAYYAVMLRPEMRDTLLHRYTTRHPVDYVIVAMFIWGLCDVAQKFLSFPREILARRQTWLPPRKGREPVANAERLLAGVRGLPAKAAESRLGRRIAQALEHVVEHGAGDEYRDHVKYLADKAEDERHTRYTLCRFVIAVTPTLGFLGTVVHFGTALSGISFDQLTDRLADVVSHMGQAFDTTTTALAASMTMMFSTFLCERVERGIDGFADRYVERELLNRFEVRQENLTPFLKVLRSANDEALRSLSGTLERQAGAWSQSLEGLFARFDERQRRESDAWSQALETLQSRQAAVEGKSDERAERLLAQLEARQERHLADIEKALTGISLLRDDFRQVGETLREMTEGEGRLLELQQSLAENVRLLNETGQIDDALHGLTAAIHLLTKRHRPGGPDAVAA